MKADCEIAALSQFDAPLMFQFSCVAHFGNYKTKVQVSFWFGSELVSLSGFHEVTWTKLKLQLKSSNLR